MTSVVIVADSGHEMARLTASVKALRATEIVRYASGRTSVAGLVAGLQPSLVLIGEMAQPIRALERLAETRAACPQSKVVVLAADSGARWLARALRAGAAAVIPGDLDAKAVGTVLQDVLVSDPLVFDPVGEAPIALVA